MGVISLRRRLEPSLNVDVYEVKLGDEFLMSSLFTVAEVALARLGLAQAGDADLDVVVGGLGLGYTAQAALDDPRVRSLVVVEALGEVIGWHQRASASRHRRPGVGSAGSPATGRLLRHGRQRRRLRSGDPGRRFHAVLLDIDHTPRHVLHPSHSAFYTPAGLGKLVGHLHPGGVFALWSDDPPDPDFEAVLAEVFDRSEASVVRFPNPLTGGYSTNTVYVAS